MVLKRKPTSLKVDPELWEEVRIMAIRVHKNITDYFEDALREKLVKDYAVVAAEKKRKEQERLHKEQLQRQYQMMVGKEPGEETGIEEERKEQPLPQQSQQSEQPQPQKSPQEQEAAVSTQNQRHALQQQQHKPEIVRLTGIGMNLPGIRFPKNKNEIIECAEDNNPITTTDFLRELPDTTYYNIAELEKTCLKIFRSEIETWNSRDKIFELHEFIIDTRDVQERRQPKQQPPDLFGRDNIVPLKNDELQLNLIIPELTIPTTKDKLLKDLSKKREEINRETHKSVQESKKKILSIMDNNITIIENLPLGSRTYNDVGELEEEIVNLFRDEKIIKKISLHRKELFSIPIRAIKPGAIVGCKILYRPDIFRNNMKLISDQEKEDLTSLRKQFSENDI